MSLPSIQKNSARPAQTFGVPTSWLVDTGCQRDLAPTSCMESHPDSVYPSSSHTFETSAGDAESEAKIRLESELLEGKATACLMDKAPPVLSVGGATYFILICWSGGHEPCWVLPSGRLLPLKRTRGAPYVDEAGPHTDPAIVPAQVPGLTIKDGIASFGVCGKTVDRSSNKEHDARTWRS